MKNSKFTFLQQAVQHRRRTTEGITFKDTEFKMTPQRKEFLEMLERQNRENQGDEK